jgi:hypothetical protein
MDRPAVAGEVKPGVVRRGLVRRDMERQAVKGTA